MKILILGMHRSGTSATARLVGMMGAYFAPEGVELGPKPDNPRGFWERRDVLQLNDELLKLQNCRWDNLAHWSFERAGQTTPALQQRMQAVIHNLDAHAPWFLKDPRLCLTLPAWLPLMGSPVATVAYRDPREIALSLQTRASMPLEYGLALWEIHAVGLLNHSMHVPRCFVRHNDILAHPVKTCQSLLDQLTGLGVPHLSMPLPDTIRAFIDPRLYRSKTLPAGMPELSAHQLLLCDMLQGTMPQNAPVALSETSARQLQSHA